MTLTQFILQIPQEAILGVSRNIWIIAIFIFATRYLGKKIGDLGKQIPAWLSTYHQNQMKEIGLQRAVMLK